MRYISAICALLVSGCAIAHDSVACEAPGPTTKIFGPELSVQDVEKIGMEMAAENPAVPQVAFAYGHERWEKLKSRYEAGDKFRQFEGSGDSDGKPIAGGYIMLRGGCVVGQIATWLS